MQFTYPKASEKDVQATGEAFSPQKRTARISKHEIYLLFLFLWVIFALLDPDPDSESGSIDLIEPGSGSETPAIRNLSTL